MKPAFPRPRSAAARPSGGEVRYVLRISSARAEAILLRDFRLPCCGREIDAGGGDTLLSDPRLLHASSGKAGGPFDCPDCGAVLVWRRLHAEEVPDGLRRHLLHRIDAQGQHQGTGRYADPDADAVYGRLELDFACIARRDPARDAGAGRVQ